MEVLRQIFVLVDGKSASLSPSLLVRKIGDRALHFLSVWLLAVVIHNYWIEIPQPIWIIPWICWLAAFVLLIRALVIWGRNYADPDVRLGGVKWATLGIMIWLTVVFAGAIIRQIA